MQDDNFLIDTFLSERSESAFRQLYRNKTPALYQMALRLTSDQLDAEELVQRTWVVAIEKIQHFRRRSTLKTWLTGILINLLKEQVRKEIKQKKTAEETAVDLVSETSTSLVTMDLEEAIKSLSPGYRQILVLHDIEGYTHKEIGELLDISSGTSKSQLFQARSILRKQLFDNYKTQ
ncbi:MAG: RNA polymerase sigma factor [Reichenbachiella sp.]|uniref:RNA polymerase sigma factor n=1 Tax=Reichenbachiella sp. TaxID=2184521 RepID=UPI003265FA33